MSRLPAANDLTEMFLGPGWEALSRMVPQHSHANTDEVGAMEYICGRTVEMVSTLLKAGRDSYDFGFKAPTISPAFRASSTASAEVNSTAPSGTRSVNVTD
jgi:hypothetical protein